MGRHGTVFGIVLAAGASVSLLLFLLPRDERPAQEPSETPVQTREPDDGDNGCEPAEQEKKTERYKPRRQRETENVLFQLEDGREVYGTLTLADGTLVVKRVVKTGLGWSGPRHARKDEVKKVVWPDKD